MLEYFYDIVILFNGGIMTDSEKLQELWFAVNGGAGTPGLSARVASLEARSDDMREHTVIAAAGASREIDKRVPFETCKANREALENSTKGHWASAATIVTIVLAVGSAVFSLLGILGVFSP